MQDLCKPLTRATCWSVTGRNLPGDPYRTSTDNRTAWILTKQFLLSISISEGDPLHHSPENDPEGEHISLGCVVTLPHFRSHVEVWPTCRGEAVLVHVPLPPTHLAEAKICHLQHKMRRNSKRNTNFTKALINSSSMNSTLKSTMALTAIGWQP